MADASVRINIPTHPGAPRDVDLEEWLDAVAFHPADTPLKQVGHELARQLIALLGTHLHQLLPPSREKALVFTALERARWAANQALAVHGGPRTGVQLETAQAILDDARRMAERIGAGLPEDPRIDDYKAAQLAETWPAGANAAVVESVEQFLDADGSRSITASRASYEASWRPVDDEPGLTHTLTVPPVEPGAGRLTITSDYHNEGENLRDSVSVEIRDPLVASSFAKVVLAQVASAWPGYTGG